MNNVQRNEKYGTHTQTESRQGSAQAGAHVIGNNNVNKDGIAPANASVASAGASASTKSLHGTTTVSTRTDIFHAGAFAVAKGTTAKVGAQACVVQAKVSLDVPVPLISENLTASVSDPTAGADAKADLKSVSLSAAVGAHAGEAQAGPFTVRAGAKFGGGIEGGVPVAHIGPVSVICDIQ